jgi:hypothetical protein
MDADRGELGEELRRGLFLACVGAVWDSREGEFLIDGEDVRGFGDDRADDIF